MKQKTILYEALEAAGAKTQYDEHVKRLLGFRPVISQILIRTMTEYAGRTAKEAAAWIEPEELFFAREGEADGSDRPLVGKTQESRWPGAGSTVYDLRVQVQVPKQKVPGRQAAKRRASKPDKEGSIVLVNLEAQKKFYQKYRLVTRGIFYGAKMLCEQYGRQFCHSNYQKLKKVYSIWICMNAPNYIGNAMVEYRLAKHDRIGSVPEQEKNYDKLSVILICLNTKKGLGEEGGIHHFLNVLLSPSMDMAEKERILSGVYGMELETTIRKELKEMCNLSEAIEEQALQRGRRAGREEGRKAGRQEGRREGRKEGRREGSLLGDAARLVKSAEAAMKSFHVDLKTACEGIGASVEEYDRAAKLLRG